jgi:hypothetical protein
MPDLGYVAVTIGNVGEEMEHGAVMPHAEASSREDGGRDIRANQFQG